ncbi:thioredoxin family protein [Rhodococcus sp. NPDC003382]
MTGIIVLLVVLVAALGVGTVLRSRSGAVREVAAESDTAGVDPLLSALGIGDGPEPVVLHFSAPWCGPCSAVRRVVTQVVDNFAATQDGLPIPRDVEVDLDENPELAKKLGVLSLPTTFLFGADGTERFRVSGVPTAADLTSALVPLRAPGDLLS